MQRFPVHKNSWDRKYHGEKCVLASSAGGSWLWKRRRGDGIFAVATGFLLLAAGGRASLCGQSVSPPRQSIRGLVLPIYRPHESQASTVARVDRIYVGHQPMGFFRFGLLPIMVADGVSVEHRGPLHLTEVLDRLISQLQLPHGYQGLEGRRIRILQQGDSQAWLEAERLVYEPKARQISLRGLVIRQSDRTIQAKRAQILFDTRHPRGFPCRLDTGEELDLDPLAEMNRDAKAADASVTLPIVKNNTDDIRQHKN